MPETTESRCDVWSIKPPDFSLKLYSRRFASKKKERKSHSSPVVARPDEDRRRKEAIIQSIVQVLDLRERKGLPQFVARYRPSDALESELLFVKNGKFHSGPYRNPKPHNFRPLNEDLPEVITSYEKDTSNLKLKMKQLDTLRTIKSVADFTLREAAAQMNTNKRAEPKWDSKLVLPPLPWPPKSASYTRHQRRRGAYSAFLDRVEEKLCRSWGE